MHTDIGGATFQDGLIGDDEGFGLLVCFAHNRNRLCNCTVGGASGLGDDVGEHETGPEFNDAGFVDLSIDGHSSFGDFAVDTHDGRVTEIIFHEPFADDDFDFITSFFSDIDFAEPRKGDGSARGNFKFTAELRLAIDAYFKAIPWGELA